MHEASVHALTDEFDGTAHRDHPDDLHRLREYGAAYNDVLFQVLWIHRGIPSCFFAVEDVRRAAASHPRPPLTVCSSTDGQLEGRHPLVLDLAVYVISGDAHVSDIGRSGEVRCIYLLIANHQGLRGEGRSLGIESRCGGTEGDASPRAGGPPAENRAALAVLEKRREDLR